MQYDAKMDIMDTSEHSWFEFFINPAKATKILKDPMMKKVLPRLCIQFTEKGFMAEKEKDKSKLGIEELNLFERKAASMRLCAMAAFAALNWDIDYIIDNVTRYELLTLRVLADHSYKIYNEKNIDATFGNWLFYRFVLSIDRRNRLPPPAPKATIPTMHNQLSLQDMAQVRHDRVQRMIMELREHVPKAKAFITELAEVPRNVIAPGIDCFLKPFAKLAPKALHAALIGDRDVLVEVPSCDFELEKIVLPAADVANKCRSELVILHFTNGELDEAKKALARIVTPNKTHPIVEIDENVFKSYSIILNVKGCFLSGNSTVIKPMVFDQKVLSDDFSIYRKSELMRERAIQETNGQLQIVYETENAAKSLIDGHAECIREKISSQARIERFVKVLRRHFEKEEISKNNEKRILINGYLQFLCATIVDLRSVLQRCGHNVENIRDIAKPSGSVPVQPLPTSQMIDIILQSNDAFWIIVTKFNVKTLRSAVQEIGSFWFPNTMPHPVSLDEIVKSEPNNNLLRLLMSKIEQLARMNNYALYRTRLEQYINEMDAANLVMPASYESIHVNATIGNRQCLLPYERKLLGNVSMEQASAIFRTDFKPTEKHATMINQCLALLLNLDEFQTVLEKGGLIPIDQFPCVPIARLLGAYAQNVGEPSNTRKCADGFSQTISQKFVAAQAKNRRDGGSDAKMTLARKELSLMLHLFKLIKQHNLVNFILAYIVSLHNRVVLTQRKLHQKIHAKLLPIFGNENSSIDIQNNSDIRQCLRMMCVKAYAIARTDPDTIRTYADFLFVEGDYQMAGQKYMEFFAAYSPNFKPTAIDSQVFNDTVLHRLRLCLSHSGYLTMALLTCQFMKSIRQSEYLKAISLIRKNLTRDVGANCGEYVIDTYAIEVLSGVYKENDMMKSLTTLYTEASSLAASKNISSYLMQQEVNRRTNKFLIALSSTFFGTHT